LRKRKTAGHLLRFFAASVVNNVGQRSPDEFPEAGVRQFAVIDVLGNRVDEI
jgi:hypothetical protein